MSPQPDADRILEAWLADGPSALPDRVVNNIVNQLDETKQRRHWWLPWRETMNRFALAAGSLAAVVLVVVIGLGLASGAGVFGPGAGATPSPTPLAPPATPESTPEPSLFVIVEHPEIGPITLTLPGPGWTGDSGGGLLVSTTKSDTGIFEFDGDLWIYRDPCAWSTTTPDAPASTVDEIIAALGSQASRDASAPADIAIGAYTGRSITLHLPTDIAVELVGDNATFPDCDEGKFGTLTNGFGGVPRSAPERYHQGPGQIDEFWVVDVNGVPVLFDLFYWPDTPRDVITDLHAMAESATFGE